MNIRIAVAFVLSVFWINIATAQLSNRKTVFDNDWRFFRGNDTAARLAIFDDSKWRNIDLPHDYSIEDVPGYQLAF